MSVICVLDERHIRNKTIILMQDSTNTMRTVVLTNKEANQYNRNKPEDVEKLWNLAKKEVT